MTMIVMVKEVDCFLFKHCYSVLYCLWGISISITLRYTQHLCDLDSHKLIYARVKALIALCLTIDFISITMSVRNPRDYLRELVWSVYVLKDNKLAL